MSASSRLPAVDVLRGLCLLGILVMNIQSFAMPHQAYLNPTAWGSLDGLDGVAWGLGRLLFDFKFITLFSTLFGASLLLGGDRTSPRRRLGWLLVFGLVHAYFVWYGDVLFSYAVVGLALLPALRWSIARQAAVGGALLLISPLLMLGLGLGHEHLPAWIHAELTQHLDPSGAAAEAAAFRGDWLAQLPVRASIAFDSQVLGLLTETGFRIAGAMLVGMAATRAGLFTRDLVSPGAVRMLWLVGLGITAAGVAVQVELGFGPRAYLLAQTLHELGSLPLAAAIALSVSALARRAAAAMPVQALERLGRLSMSAYLSQSLIGTFLFGGHGLGLFGAVDRFGLLLIAVGIYAAQLALAWWWSARYRVGPFEALWRGLSRGDFSLHPLRAA